MDKEKLIHICKKITMVERLLNSLVDDLLRECDITREDIDGSDNSNS